MKPVIVEKYNKNVFFLEFGNRTHYLYMNNVDFINTLVLFSVLMFDDAELRFNCDINFWQEWIDYYSAEKKVKKNIKFVGDNVPIMKLDATSTILYSGGKDSEYTRLLYPHYDLLQFRAQVYRVMFNQSAFKMSSNFDNEIFYSRPSIRSHVKLEIILPIISPFNSLVLGIEKEIWDYSKLVYGYNYPEYVALLQKHNIFVTSEVNRFYSNEILKDLKSLDATFVKCGDFLTKDRIFIPEVLKNNDFCYNCHKCFIYYFMGCNKEIHNFDREKFEKIREEKGNPIHDVKDFLSFYLKSNKDEISKPMYDTILSIGGF